MTFHATSAHFFIQQMSLLYNTYVTNKHTRSVCQKIKHVYFLKSVDEVRFETWVQREFTLHAAKLIQSLVPHIYLPRNARNNLLMQSLK